MKNIFYSLAILFKSSFQEKEIKIIVYDQYLLSHETPIKENPSELTRRQTLFCQCLEHHKFPGLHLPELIFSHSHSYHLNFQNTQYSRIILVSTYSVSQKKKSNFKVRLFKDNLMVWGDLF